MSHHNASDQIEQNIASALETLIQKRPVLETILRSFGEILTERKLFAQELQRELQQVYLDLDYSRLLQGVPLLSGFSFDVLQDPLNRSFALMLAVLKRTIPNLKADSAGIDCLHREGRLDLIRLSRAYLDGEISILRNSAEAAHVSEGILALLLHTMLAPLLDALTVSVGERIKQSGWNKGYCPVCGSMPSMSYLAEACDLGSEFLKGGGGQRYLHCSLCGYDWRVKRNMCPACETEDKDLRLYFQVQDEHAERLDVCRNCGGYLPCLDLRQSAFKPQMDIAAVGMLHLAVWAAEKGYHPLAQTPWNFLQ